MTFDRTPPVVGIKYKATLSSVGPVALKAIGSATVNVHVVPAAGNVGGFAVTFTIPTDVFSAKV